MAISRSLMNRQLRADGGIMQVAPREKFGLGSKLKKFVRKIIPNEVADIAVKAAPFVAPFNPAVAAAMSGLGTFDQTGSIGKSLKGAGMNYAGGQAARYLGGADFQGNPFSADGGAFRGGLEGLKGGFSSPLGNQTGFKLGKPVQEVQGVGIDTTVPKPKPTNLLSEQMSEVSLSPNGSVVTSDSILTSPSGSGSAMDSFKSIVSFDTSAGQKTDAALDLLKRGSKAIFYDKDGNLDRAAVLGAVTAAASYAEALALANDAGIELTEDDYNQAQADEKKAEYAGYLTNFFGGKKDGGRIGFESGANEMIKTQLLEEIMPEQDGEEMITIMTEDGPIQVKKSVYESMPQMFMDTTTSVFGDAGRGRRIPEEFRADGGRIGRKFGSPEEGESEVGIMAIDVEAGDDEDEEDMMMAGITFSRPEKSYLFRRLGGSGGSDRSYTMPNLYKILSNPNKYPEDAAILKEIAIMGLGEGQKDGGRIGFNDGSSTGSFGTDRYLSEMLESGSDLFNRGGDFFDKYEDMVKEGKLDSRMFDMLKEYKTLEKEAETTDDKFQNINLIDKAEKTLGKDALKYYDKKFKDLEKQEDNLTKQEEGIIALEKKTNFDASEITKTPDFQNWLSLYETDKMKAFDHPYADIYLGVLGVKLKGRDKSYDEIVGLANGGRIGYKGGANRVSELLILRDSLLASGEDVSDIEAEIFQLTGKTFKSVGGISDIPTGNMRKNNAGVVERDYRDEGGFVPVGIKERADDVPAMLSKNEFVMTADAVRGIGNGSVEEGSKKLYNTMKQAEKVGKA